MNKNQKYLSLIPNSLTISNACLGFAAICINDLLYSSICLLLAMFVDVFDGAIARALKVDGPLGIQLDSLADMISFGAAPAYLYWQVRPGDELWLFIGPLLILIGTLWRLANFNIAEKSNDFIGVPSPANALLLIGIFLALYVNNSFVETLIHHKLAYISIGLLSAILMVCKLRMLSLKNIGESNFVNLLLFSVGLSFIFGFILNIGLSLLIGMMGYLLLSIMYNVKKTDT